MSKVYFKAYEGSDLKEWSKLGSQMLDQLIADFDKTLESTIPIKVHFGEKGNHTFVPAEVYDGMIQNINNREIETAFIETNVLYRGDRTTKENHINLAKTHGFTKLPIIIADGERGEEIHEVMINQEYFESVKLGKAYKDYKQIVVTSHFKGHGLAGFGGALKQLAMGFASRSGKMAQHSRMVPRVTEEKCIECGLCVEKCDVSAITLNPKAEIDENLCVGCAGCIAVCPEAAIRNDWGALNFREKVAEYAYGAQLNQEHFYISFLFNITKECDCIGQAMAPITKNFGVMASLDPVALDHASIDLIQRETGSNLFDTGRETLKHCKDIGFGSDEYEIIEV
jgi:hypothetical protein